MDATAEQGGTSGRPAETTDACRYSANRRARLRRHRWRRTSLAFAVSFVGLFGPGAASASDVVVVIAGECDFALSLTLTNPASVTHLPSTAEWSVSDTTTCTVQVGSSTVELDGTLTGTLSTATGQPLANCAAGVLVGELDFSLDVVGFSTVDLTAAAVEAGAVISLATAGGTRLVGAGAFTQTPPTTTTCTAGLSSKTWNGNYVFVDPVLGW